LSDKLINTTESIQEKLQKILPVKTYNTWLKNCDFEVSNCGQKLTVTAANPFIKDWLTDHYYQQIKEAARESTGNSMSIDFIIKNTAQQADTASTVTVKPAAKSPARKTQSSRLNKDFTFENFITGDCNKIAFESARLIVDSPGLFNPLTICGSCGTGKTHLLHAVCNKFQEDNPSAKLVYFSAEQFTSEYMMAVTSKNRHVFINKLRTADMLVIDDINYFAVGNKDATQEELIHAIEFLSNAGKQVLFSSGVDVNEIEGLKDRLQKRIVSGLVLPLAELDKKTRINVINEKAENRNITLSDDMIDFICTYHSGCIREIEGAVAKLAAFYTLGSIDVTDDLAQGILGKPKVQDNPLQRPDLATVCKSVCESFAVKAEDLKGRSRSLKIRQARTAAMIIARDITGCSFTEIGDYFGKRQHATVLTAIKSGRKQLANDELYCKRIEMIKNSFGFKSQNSLF
jgi:chromosomal replication initiator protein